MEYFIQVHEVEFDVVNDPGICEYCISPEAHRLTTGCTDDSIPDRRRHAPRAELDNADGLPCARAMRLAQACQVALSTPSLCGVE